LNSPPSVNSLSPPLIPGTVSAGLIFAFTYMCIYYLYNIHPPTPFPAASPLPLVPTPAPWAELVSPSCSPIL
jgi:hypothetical protein